MHETKIMSKLQEQLNILHTKYDNLSKEHATLKKNSEDKATLQKKRIDSLEDQLSKATSPQTIRTTTSVAIQTTPEPTKQTNTLETLQKENKRLKTDLAQLKKNTIQKIPTGNTTTEKKVIFIKPNQVTKNTAGTQTEAPKHNTQGIQTNHLKATATSTQTQETFEPTSPQSQNRHRSMQAVIYHLEILRQKTKKLKEKNALKAAQQLTKTLQTHVDNYLNDTSISLKTFQDKAKRAVNNAKPTFKTSDGWKRLLGNLLIAITTLSAGFFVNKALTGQFLFFTPSNINETLAELTDSLGPSSNAAP